jgi:hypothetical protein
VLQAGKTFLLVVASLPTPEDVSSGFEKCERLLDEKIAVLALLGGSDLVRFPIFRGWHLKPGVILTGHSTVLPQVNTVSEELLHEMLTDPVFLERKSDDRFQLMAYLFSRAIAETRPEFKFLQLWFTLEIFPMVEPPI